MSQQEAVMDVIGAGDQNRWQPERSPTAAGKPVKKKKSLPRMFVLSRKKSTKSKSPVSDRLDEHARPMQPTRLASGTSTDTTRSTSSKEKRENTNAGERALRECGPNVPRSAREQSPMDLPDAVQSEYTCLEAISKRQNESIQPLCSRELIHHQQFSSTTSQPVTDQLVQAKGPHNDLHISPSLGALSRSKPSLLQQQDSSPFLARPHTAIEDKLPKNNARCELENTPIRVSSARNADEEDLRTRLALESDQWVQWHGSYTKECERKSTRSGLSNDSISNDSRNTEHSSIFTKMSSASDMTIELEDTPSLKHTSMTVDDTIDLYSAGFDDDFDLEEGDPMKSPSADEEDRRRSMKIAEAMSDDIDTALLEPPSSVFLATPRSSADTMSGAIFRPPCPQPPPISRPTSTHDQYGFRKASRDVTIAQYDAWHKEYAPIQVRRTNKWIHLMQDHSLPIQNPTRFPSRSTKVQRFIRKGIPPAWRGSAWFFYTGGEALLKANPDLYTSLILQLQTSKLNPNDKESIERDLHRTFPDNLHFKPDAHHSPPIETPLLSSLRRVLCAFAIHHPRIGYCQSLNFLAGLLLLFLPEEKAFWLLHIITARYLPGTHEISLEGANVDLWVLMLALKDALPSIWDKIGGEVHTSTTRLPPISLCTTSWFMSLFIGTLPVESVLRVWDVLFYEGSRTLFRVALGIFKLGESEIRGVSDPMEVFQVVQALPRRMLGIGALMAVACRRGTLGQDWVERRRRERREWFKRERVAEWQRKEGRVGREGVDDKEEVEVKTGRSRSNSAWKSRIGLGRG